MSQIPGFAPQQFSRKNIVFRSEVPRELPVYTRAGGTMRFIPSPSFDAQGNPEPWRKSKDECAYGDFVRGLPVAHFWGTPDKVSCIDICSDQHDRFGMFGVMNKIYEVLKAEKASNPSFKWPGIVDGNRQTGTIFRPNRFVFVQGWLIEEYNPAANGGQGAQVPYNPPKWCILVLKASAATNFVTMTSKLAGNEVDPAKAFECGDILDPAATREWQFYQTYMKTQSGQSMVSIGLKFGNAYPLNQQCAISIDESRKRWRPWDQLLHIPTRKELWALATTAVGPEVVGFCGKDEIENLPMDAQRYAEYWRVNPMSGAVMIAPNAIPQQMQPATAAYPQPMQPAQQFAAPARQFAPAPAAVQPQTQMAQFNVPQANSGLPQPVATPQATPAPVAQQPTPQQLPQAVQPYQPQQTAPAPAQVVPTWTPEPEQNPQSDMPPFNGPQAVGDLSKMLNP